MQLVCELWSDFYDLKLSVVQRIALYILKVGLGRLHSVVVVTAERLHAHLVGREVSDQWHYDSRSDKKQLLVVFLSPTTDFWKLGPKPDEQDFIARLCNQQQNWEARILVLDHCLTSLRRQAASLSLSTLLNLSWGITLVKGCDCEAVRQTFMTIKLKSGPT